MNSQITVGYFKYPRETQQYLLDTQALLAPGCLQFQDGITTFLLVTLKLCEFFEIAGIKN